jgi:hypothetical protein
MRERRNRWVAGWVVVVGLTVAGCTSIEAAPSVESGPAQVQPIPGSDRSQVILTEEAARRVGIKTEPISSAGSQSVIPLTAVLYDKDGRTWTYTNPAPLTYLPEELVIARVDGVTAIMQSGPAAGTLVVTVGGAELLGAEYGVSGE